jgi:putative ABC transport system ATP-binding protein
MSRLFATCHRLSVIKVKFQEKSMSRNTIVQAENIQRHLPQGGRELYILNGISFAAEAGSWLALTGPSGSGKSTLLGILAGIDRPSAGKVTIEGMEISALPEGRLARLRNEKIGVVFQSFHLIPTMTALENVEAPLYIHPQKQHARSMAITMLRQVGLNERQGHFPHQLSGGEQQRVAIARALVCGPGILLADEPTGNLDTATSKQVLDLIHQLRDQLGLTVIMVTHDPAVAARADRRLHIVDGRLADAAPPTPVASSSFSTLTGEVRA